MYKSKTFEVNNLTVVHTQTPHPFVDIRYAIAFGSCIEPVEGIAHFIEHLMFTATSNKTEQEIHKDFSKRGIVANAFTGYDTTQYYMQLPKETFLEAKGLLDSLVWEFNAKDDLIERERSTIKEEMNYTKTQLGSMGCRKTYADLFGSKRGHSILGSVESLDTINSDNLTKCVNSSYLKDNAVLYVTGDITEAELAASLDSEVISGYRSDSPISLPSFHDNLNFDESHFTLKEGGVNSSITSTPDSDSKPAYVYVTSVIPFPTLDIPMLANLTVLSTVIGNDFSSLLFKKLRMDSGLVYSVHTSPQVLPGCILLETVANTSSNTATEVKDIIEKTHRTFDKSMNKEHLDNGKMVALSHFLASTTSATCIAEFQSSYPGSSNFIYNYHTALKAVSQHDLESSMQTIIQAPIKCTSIIDA